MMQRVIVQGKQMRRKVYVNSQINYVVVNNQKIPVRYVKDAEKPHWSDTYEKTEYKEYTVALKIIHNRAIVKFKREDLTRDEVIEYAQDMFDNNAMVEHASVYDENGELIYRIQDANVQE